MSLTPEQKEKRKSGIYASDVARIMIGDSVRLALEKMGEIESDGDDLEDVVEVQIGHLIEPKIMDAYEHEYAPMELRRSPNTMNHPDYPWLGCHLDAIALGTRDTWLCDVEAKSVGWYRRREWGDGGDEVPDRVLWQVEAQLAAARFNGERFTVAHVPVCFINEESLKQLLVGKIPPISLFVIPADAELEYMLIEKSKQIWNCIETHTLPPPEKIQDVRLLYRKDEGQAVEAPDELKVVHGDLLKLQERIKKAESQEERFKFQLQEFMKSAAILRHENRTIATWKNDRDSSRVDLKKLEENYPEVYKDVLKPTKGARKFLVKEPKEFK